MVRFNDIVPVAARAPRRTTGIIKGRFKIQKMSDDKMLAFGWANVAITAAGKQLRDYHDDLIDPDELEQAAYAFVELYREGGEMHERGGCAVLVESMVFTKEKQIALGIPKGTLPEGWWIGFKVTDPDVWDKVKTGEYGMFSIEGTAIREKVSERRNLRNVTKRQEGWEIIHISPLERTDRGQGYRT